MAIANEGMDKLDIFSVGICTSTSVESRVREHLCRYSVWRISSGGWEERIGSDLVPRLLD